MKVIPKLQKGDSFLSLFADYNLIERPKRQQSSSQSSGRTESKDTDKGKLTEKDLFSLLKDVDGLPNEVQALVQSISQMYQYDSLVGGDFDTQGLASLYAKNIIALKRANFNKNEYDKAYKQIEERQGLNEFAVTSSGKLFVQTEDGNMTQVDVKEYLNNTDKYQALSNSNLLWYRAHDPRFINENQVIFDTVNNGIGLSEIHKMIKERMSNLGTSESTQQGYIAKNGNKIMKGLQVIDDAKEYINQGMTLDGIYKSKVIDKNQKEQAQAALQYIYSMLPNNAKTILALHSGNKKNPNQGAIDIISKMITSTLDETHSVEFNYEDDLNPDGSKKSSSKSGSGKGPEDIKETVASQFLKGYGHKELFTVNPGTNLSTYVQSSTLPLTDKSNNPLGNMCSLQEVSEGGYQGILDWNSATMGGRFIKTTDLRKVLVSDGNAYHIDFPIDENGNPDLRPTTLKAKNKADEMIKSAGIDINDQESRKQNASKINQILEECGLPSAYDSSGNIIGDRWAEFAVMNGIADSKALGMSDLEDGGMYLQELDEDRQESVLETLKAKQEDPKNKYKFDESNWLFFHGDDYLYEGTIWIPVKNNAWNSLIGSDIKQGQGFQLEEMQLISDELNKKSRLESQYNYPKE